MSQRFVEGSSEHSAPTVKYATFLLIHAVAPTCRVVALRGLTLVSRSMRRFVAATVKPTATTVSDSWLPHRRVTMESARLVDDRFWPKGDIVD